MKKRTPHKTKFDIGRNIPRGLQPSPSTQPTAGRTSEGRKAGTEPVPSPTGRAWNLKKRAVTALLCLLAALIILASVITVWDAHNISSAANRMFGSGNLFRLLNSSSLATDPSSGRVNLLIAGYSADDPGHAGATLTDSIILLSMDPARHTGYMLSIPRDLYVALPGFGYGKINQAYKDGGMGLLRQVVEKDFDTKVGYWALVDYTAVRDIVNAVGGINVTIKSPDGKLYDPNKDWTTGGPLVDLSNGPHRLNGEQALDLSRARGDPSPYGIPIGFEQSDFQRTADQRLILKTIKAKLNWTLILNPLTNGKILSAVADNVKTNLTIREVRPLFGLFNSIPDSKMQSLSLRDLAGKNYLSSYDSYYSGSALIPSAGLNDYSQINAALDSYSR